MYNVLWRDAQAEFWNLLHDGYAEELGWTTVEPDEFENDEVRDFVANVIIYNAKQYDKREKKGLRVKIKNVAKTIRARKKRTKVREFFSSIFKRKNKSDF